MAELVECLLIMHAALGLNPSLVVHICNHSILQVAAGRSEVQRHPRLHSKLEASLDYMRPYLKMKYLELGLRLT